MHSLLSKKMSTLISKADNSVPDRGSLLVGMLWPFTGLAFITLILRLAFRSKARKVGWDDGFMILSMLCFFGWSTTLTFYANKGGEQHFWDVLTLGLDNLAQVQLLNWTSQVFGIMGVCFGKISISALLLGIIKNSDMHWHRLYLWIVTIGLASAIAVTGSVLTMSQCSPPARLWDSRIEGTCIDPSVMSGYGTFIGSFNTFADASLAILPATVFWKLAHSPLKRIQLSIVFGLNILTSVCSGIKTQYLAQLANRTDLTWATFDIFAWVTLELFLMIVCGTVPTLLPLLAAIQTAIEKTKTKLRRSSRTKGSSGSPGNAPPEDSRELMTIGRLPVRKLGRKGRDSLSTDHLFDEFEDLESQTTLNRSSNKDEIDEPQCKGKSRQVSENIAQQPRPPGMHGGLYTHPVRDGRVSIDSDQTQIEEALD